MNMRSDLNLHIAYSLLVLILFITGCSSKSSDDPFDTPHNVLTGSFRDSAVQGLDYSSARWSGVTTRGGEFVYQPGEEVSFSVGGIALGTSAGKKNVTPLDVVAGAEDSTNPIVNNMCRLLMSLDQDANPGNGIVITEETKSILSKYPISLDQPLDSNPLVAELFAELNEVAAEEDSGPQRELVSSQAAVLHLENTLAEISSEEAEAEDIKLKASITSPDMNIILVQGQYIPVAGSIIGGSGTYNYVEWSLWDKAGKKYSGGSPPDFISNLNPGTYVLMFTAQDTDNGYSSDTRYITILNPADCPVPAVDEPMVFFFQNIPYDPALPPYHITIKNGEPFNLVAKIKTGNPPFRYSWYTDGSFGYSFTDNPLDLTLSFPGPAVYTIRLTMYDSINNDWWPDQLYIHVTE